MRYFDVLVGLEPQSSAIIAVQYGPAVLPQFDSPSGRLRVSQPIALWMASRNSNLGFLL